MNSSRVKKIFEGYLGQAQKSKFILKPYSWALYHTWKVVDEIEKVKQPTEEPEDNVTFDDLLGG